MSGSELFGRPTVQPLAISVSSSQGRIRASSHLLYQKRMNTGWVGRFDDPTIKKVNFIKGNQVVADGEGKDYFAEFEEKIKEENEKREREIASLSPTFVGYPTLTVKGDNPSPLAVHLSRLFINLS